MALGKGSCYLVPCLGPPDWSPEEGQIWKRPKGKNQEGKNFLKLLRRKQSSAKISKISDIFYPLKDLLKHLLQIFFSPRSFQKFLPLAFLPSGSFRQTLLTFYLLTSEDFWFFLIFPAIAGFSAHLSEGIETLRSPRKERKSRNPH